MTDRHIIRKHIQIHISMQRSLLSSTNHLIIAEKNWRQLRIYRRHPFHPELPALLTRIFADPDSIIEQGTVIKNENKTTLSIITHGEIELVIKRYNIINIRHRILSSLRMSRAYRCWVYAHLFKDFGLDTPEPVAMIEQRLGPIRKHAYFIMRYKKGELGRTAIPKATPQQLELYLQSLQNNLVVLHDRMITHGDLKTTNLLWNNNKWIWLDLDATRQHRYRRSFTIAWQRDMRRLLKNWQNHPEIQEKAKATIPWLSNINLKPD